MSEYPLLDRILGSAPPAYALLHRPETTGRHLIDIVVGDVVTAERLVDLPLPAPNTAPGLVRHDLLALVPFRQITERGFAAIDDGAELQALRVTEQASVPLAALFDALPPATVSLVDGRFDTDDAAYADTVAAVVRDEIGRGVGANFVIRRDYVGHLLDYSPATALRIFERLVQAERGTYCTFVVHTGASTLVGATPERHISVSDDVAVMNPISGTYRYPSPGPSVEDLLAFLQDTKETDELFMVVDEELKMMARICPDGGRVQGPLLKEMSRLAHTEYLITGRTSRDPREILHETMFAPTVTGSPLESACRVIARHEPSGRRYYSGVLALISSVAGRYDLDSAILIRTAEIDGTGALRYGVGATLVRSSDPLSEAAETRAKVAGFLGALERPVHTALADHPDVRDALDSRNDAIAPFWLGHERSTPPPRPADDRPRSVLVVDAEDTFTAMIALQLRALGLQVTVAPFDGDLDTTGHDLVVMGPGPGDPHDTDDRRIAAMTATTRRLLDTGTPFLAICLSHQILCLALGLPVRRRREPHQGVQVDIELFGVPRRVGFYNTFAARAEHDVLDTAHGPVRLSRDPWSHDVHAVHGRHFASVQFHPESILTLGGPAIFDDLLALLPTRGTAADRPVAEVVGHPRTG